MDPRLVIALTLLILLVWTLVVAIGMAASEHEYPPEREDG